MNTVTTPVAMDEATARRNVIRQANASITTSTPGDTVWVEPVRFDGPISMPAVSLPTKSNPARAPLEETRASLVADLPGIRAQIAAALARPEHKDVSGAEHRRLAQLAEALVEALDI